MGGSLKREGTYVYLWLVHVDVWQKGTQYCREIILQLKINKFNCRKIKKKKKGIGVSPEKQYGRDG